MRLAESERKRIQDAVAAERLVETDPDAVAAAVTVSVIDIRGLDLRNRRFCDGDVCPLDALVFGGRRGNRNLFVCDGACCLQVECVLSIDERELVVRELGTERITGDEVRVGWCNLDGDAVVVCGPVLDKGDVNGVDAPGPELFVLVQVDGERIAIYVAVGFASKRLPVLVKAERIFFDDICDEAVA